MLLSSLTITYLTVFCNVHAALTFISLKEPPKEIFLKVSVCLSVRPSTISTSDLAYRALQELEDWRLLFQECVLSLAPEYRLINTRGLCTLELRSTHQIRSDFTAHKAQIGRIMKSRSRDGKCFIFSISVSPWGHDKTSSPRDSPAVCGA